MTDEPAVPAEDPKDETHPPTLVDVWEKVYERVLLRLVGNTLNRADKQQYRLKAAQTADMLTQLEIRIAAYQPPQVTA